MKKALIAVISVILVLDLALIVYGAAFIGNKSSSEFDLDPNLLPPESPRIYAHDIAEWVEKYAISNDHRTLSVALNPSKDPEKFAAEVDGWYDVFGEADPATSILARYTGADLVANLMIPVTYNHNRTKQYCLMMHFEVTAGSNKIVSDNMRVKYQPAPATSERYYLSLVWTGKDNKLSNIGKLSVEFSDDKRESTCMIKSHDDKTNAYNYQFNTKPSKETREDQELEREIPAKIYDMLCFPLYLGGGHDKDTQYYAKVESDVLDGKTVKLTEPTEENKYYTLTFSEDLSKAQRSENLACLNGALGDQMSNIKIKESNFLVEIWESGLYRQLQANFVLNAKINGKQGDVKVKMSYKFLYDDYSCDIVRLIDGVGWTKYLSKSNQDLLASRRRDYSAKEN